MPPVLHSIKARQPILRSSRPLVGLCAVFLGDDAWCQAAIPTSSMSGLCIIPLLCKYICGIVGVVAIVLWALRAMNTSKDNEYGMHRLVEIVGLPCVIVAIAAQLIQQFGLVPGCTL
jgi:hypothetical protein